MIRRTGLIAIPSGTGDPLVDFYRHYPRYFHQIRVIAADGSTYTDYQRLAGTVDLLRTTLRFLESLKKERGPLAKEVRFFLASVLEVFFEDVPLVRIRPEVALKRFEEAADALKAKKSRSRIVKTPAGWIFTDELVDGWKRVETDCGPMMARLLGKLRFEPRISGATLEVEEGPDEILAKLEKYRPGIKRVFYELLRRRATLTTRQLIESLSVGKGTLRDARKYLIAEGLAYEPNGPRGGLALKPEYVRMFRGKVPK